MKKIALFSLSLLLILVLFSGCGKSPKIQLEKAALSPSKLGNGVYSGFMEIYNTGGKDTLLSFTVQEFPSARCELHDVKDGKMHEVKNINIPAVSKVELKRGSLHLMIFELPEATKIASEITLMLNFQKSGKMAVKTKVESPTSSPTSDASMHKM